MRAGAVLVVSAGLLFLAFAVSVAHPLSGGPSRADPSVHNALSALPEVIEAAPLGAGGNAWTPGKPSARSFAAMGYDVESDRIILFGGSAVGGVYLDDTWAYDLNTNSWRYMNPASHPLPRISHAMAYDAESDRIVLFGGVTSTERSDETWTFNFNTNVWTNMSPAVKPTGRSDHAMAYDAESDRIVLFGGFAGSYNDETWSYDFNANTWTNMAPAVKPSARSDHAMAYDTPTDRILLFGGAYGLPAEGMVSDETWSYDFNANTWANMAPTSKPSARAGHAMAYIAPTIGGGGFPGGDRVLLFGGGGFLGDTWAYHFEANSWANMNPPTAPPSRTYHTMAYDTESNRVVMFGGSVLAGALDDTWAYILDSFNNQWVKPGTPGRVEHAMAYDAQSDRTVMFGGLGLAGERDDTWAYDLETNAWTDMMPATHPSVRDGHGMAYDSQSDRVLLFGGYSGGTYYDDTWSYDLNANTWTNMNPAAAPPARDFHAMAYDVESDRIVLFGGYVPGSGEVDETWAYDLNTNTWTAMNPVQRPLPRYSFAMDYDAESDRVVLFGGTTFAGTIFDDTWSYDLNANTWTNMNPTTKPVGTALHAMAYDTLSDRTMMFGGYATGLGLSDETWSYDINANTWTNMKPTVKPTGRTEFAMAYDSQSDRTVMFGGGTATGFTDETWWYHHPNYPSAARSLQGFAGNARVTLAWLPPASDGDSAITAYRIYRGTSPGGESLLSSVSAALTNVTDTGLTNGVLYYYQVTAVNAIGEGPRSNEVSATPTSPVPPTAPRNLQAAAGNVAVSLSWLAPSSDGGSPITNYKVYRGTTSGALSLVGTVANVLAYSETGLTNGVTYYYQVTATNGVGEGPRSSEASATPSTTADATDPTIAITSPSAGATLTSASATVSGTAADNVAVQKVEISSDGTTWLAATGTTAWFGTLTLAEGPNTIHARVTDTSGHTATISVSVTVAVPVTNQGIPAYVLIGALVAVAAAAGVAVFLFWWRRKGKGEVEKPRT